MAPREHARKYALPDIMAEPLTTQPDENPPERPKFQEPLLSPRPIATPTIGRLKGITAMPGPLSRNAPYFSDDEESHLCEFLGQFENLASACNLTNREKCQAIMQYVDFPT